MIYSYEELKIKKEQGENLNWEQITKEQLESLFIDDNIPNSLIADLYDVESDEVKKKRYKWNIKYYPSVSIMRALKKGDTEALTPLNMVAKNDLLQAENIEMIAKSITHYIFRNGPVENMHANNQLSGEDMKTLNKYMVDKLSSLLTLAFEGEWYKLRLIIKELSHYGTNWDKPEINNDYADMLYKRDINNL